MVRIGILEDEAAYSERLLTYLKQYQTENPDFSYTTEIYTTGIALLTKFASQFDLLFLDIQLPDMTGIEVARRIREKDESIRGIRRIGKPFCCCRRRWGHGCSPMD